MSTIIMNLRGARETPIHRGSVLLSKQEDLCSTSYVSNLVSAGGTRRAMHLKEYFLNFIIFKK